MKFHLLEDNIKLAVDCFHGWLFPLDVQVPPISIDISKWDFYIHVTECFIATSKSTLQSCSKMKQEVLIREHLEEVCLNVWSAPCSTFTSEEASS